MTKDLATIVTALTIYAVVVVSPGPAFAVTTRMAVAGPRSTAFAAIFGLASAATIYAVLTMTGLALLLTRMQWLASAIQIAGGCYLIYLGISAWRTAAPAAESRGQPKIHGALRGFRTGLVAGFANPKAIAFFLSFYAVAVPLGTALWAKGVILFGGFMLEIVWYGLAALLLSTPPARAAFDRFRAGIERAIGVMLAGFGVRLIAEKL